MIEHKSVMGRSSMKLEDMKLSSIPHVPQRIFFSFTNCGTLIIFILASFYELAAVTASQFEAPIIPPRSSKYDDDNACPL